MIFIDKWFFHIFFFFLISLFIAMIWLFIGKPAIACTEITAESKFIVDEEDRDKRCFNVWEVLKGDVKTYNEYLEEKYPSQKSAHDYLIERFYPNKTINYTYD